MKKLLLTLSTVIVLLTVFSLVITASAAHSYVQSVEVLEQLGIVSDVNTMTLADGIVTKSDALNMIINTYYPGAKLNGDGEQVFGDVPKGDMYYNIVALGKQLGIVKPTDGFSFGGSEPITTDEFARMLIRAIGYENKAARYKYAVSGYTSVAFELDILYRNDISDDGYISPGQMYNAIYESLFVKPVVSYQVDGKLVSYVDDDSTIAEAYFGCKSAEGVCFANEYTSLYGETTAKKGQFSIKTYDGIKYTFDGTIDDYQNIGYNVKVFYKEGRQKNEVICTIRYDNEILEISKDEFDYIDLGQRKVHYHENVEKDTFTKVKKDKTASLPNADIDFVYNGQYTSDTSYIIDFLDNPSAFGMTIEKISLIDNDLDSKYEIISIDAYRDIHVNFVNGENESLADENGYTFKMNDKDYYIFRDSEGEATKFESIGVDNIIRVKTGLGSPALVDVWIYSLPKVVAYVQTITEDGDDIILELGLAETTARGTSFVGSLTGGNDNEIPIVRYKVADSFKPYVDALKLNKYSFYNFFVNKDNEIIGSKIYKFDKYISAYGADSTAVGSNTYTVTNLAVALAVAKSSGLKDNVKIKVYNYPQETRTLSVRDFEFTSDFKIKNIEDCCLNIPNHSPETFYVKYVDGAPVVEQEKVDLYYKLMEEYQTYGEDGSKYSADVLKFMFGRKLFTYKINSDYKIYEVSLPHNTPTTGELSYQAVPGQSYYIDQGYYSLYDGTKHALASKALKILVPDPECSYADWYDLCFQATYSGPGSGYNEYVKMDYYTFNPKSPMAEFAVWYFNYDMISPHEGSSDSGIVAKATKGASPFGYNVDNFYIYGALDSHTWGAKRYYGIYEKNYKMPAVQWEGPKFVSKFRYPAEFGSATGVDSKYLQEHYISDFADSKVISDIEAGDIITVYFPIYSYFSEGYSPFNAVSKIYDCGTDKFSTSVSASSLNFGDRAYMAGRIFKVEEDAVAILPWAYEKFEDYTPKITDCFIAQPNMMKIYKCVKMHGGGYNVTLGEYSDLYQAKAENARVIAHANSASSSSSAAKTIVYLYLSE